MSGILKYYIEEKLIDTVQFTLICSIKIKIKKIDF